MRPLLCMLLCASAAALQLVARPPEAGVDLATVDSDRTDSDAAPASGEPSHAAASPWRFGRATYYGDAPADDLSAGACGFGDQVAVDGVAAVADASPELNDGPPCGRCYELRCVPALVPSEGTTLPRCGACRRDAPPLLVRITDACPCKYAPNAASNTRWCCGDAPHFDLAARAYDKLAASRAGGVLGVAFRRVPCAPYAARRNVTLRVAAAYAGARSELVVLDAAGAGGVSLLEARAGGDATAAWTPLRRGWGATWQLPWPAAAGGGVSVRVTAEDGAQLTLADVIAGPEALRAGALLRTDAQFAALPLPPPPPQGWPGQDDDLAPLLRCPAGAGALAAAAKAAQALVAATTGGAPPSTPCLTVTATTAAAAAPQLPAWCRIVPAAMPQQLRPAGCVAAAAAALAAQSCGEQ